MGKNFKSNCPATGISNIYTNSRNYNVGDFAIGIDEYKHLCILGENIRRLCSDTINLETYTKDKWTFFQIVREYDMIKVFMDSEKRMEKTLPSSNFSFTKYYDKSEIGAYSDEPSVNDSIDGLLDDFKITISPRGTYVIKNLKQY